MATALSRLEATALLAGVGIVVALMSASVWLHPTSLEESGFRFLGIDVVLLSAYAVLALWVRRRGSSGVLAAVHSGTIGGLFLGTVLAANHLTEIFVADRSFVLVIGPVFLALAIFSAAGSSVTERNRSILPAAMAGVWCAMLGVLVLLCCGVGFNLVCETRAELWLRSAFVASGEGDPGGFLVRNTLESASEGLVRMPVLGAVVAFLGAVASVWLARLSRATVVVSLISGVLLFAAGAAALWHANSLARAARPPFVMAGALLTGIALSALPAARYALRRSVEV